MEFGLLPTDRVLVLGATGWFGQTLLSMLDPSQVVLLVSSSTRDRYVAWDAALVRGFKPTVVANFAFLTRERVESDGEEQFTSVNAQLTEQFLLAAALPSVRAALTVSSGAAVSEPLSPYGRMKLAEESAALELVTPDRAVVVGRAYSVSGGYVRRPHDYAFSNLILQAAKGQVQVVADRPVLRRYVSVDDFLTVCLGRAVSGWSGVIDSGGELVEMGNLAERIVRVVNPSASVTRASQSSSKPSVYASDDGTWRAACTALGFLPADLESQIRATAVGLGCLQ